MDRPNGKISTVIQFHIIYTQAVFSVASFKHCSTSWQVSQSSVCIPWCLSCVKVFTESFREIFQSTKTFRGLSTYRGLYKGWGTGTSHAELSRDMVWQCGCGLRSLRFGKLYFYIHRGLLAVENVSVCVDVQVRRMFDIYQGFVAESIKLKMGSALRCEDLTDALAWSPGVVLDFCIPSQAYHVVENNGTHVHQVAFFGLHAEQHASRCCLSSQNCKCTSRS